MSKVKINAVDKIIIPQFFPQTESILVQMMARDIGRKIEVTEKDREAIKLKSLGQGLSWNSEKVAETETEIEFTKAEIKMLQDRVKSLDQQKKISSGMLDTCIKIQGIKTVKEPTNE